MKWNQYFERLRPECLTELVERRRLFIGSVVHRRREKLKGASSRAFFPRPLHRFANKIGTTDYTEITAFGPYKIRQDNAVDFF
jgi:hypothetical protein